MEALMRKLIFLFAVTSYFPNVYLCAQSLTISEARRLTGSIPVGSTYQEVEHLVGKPSSLERGFNLLVTLPEESASDIIDGKHRMTDVKLTVETRGQLMYTSWVYAAKAFYDTACIPIMVRNESFETVLYAKKFFVVMRLFCVTFDASSGRVTQSTFQPFQIVEKMGDEEVRMRGLRGRIFGQSQL
jgi:hypothetical protein